jgi:type I restriction enzyme S subunit
MKFYKETNFQETPIGKIPKDWEVMRATDVAEYINGYPFSPKDWKTSGIPIIRIQNLNDPNAEFNFFDGEIDEIYKVKNGDLLLSWSASIGVYIWKRGDAVLNQHIFKVIPKPKVNKLFLYYALFLAIEQLKRRVHGSTMKHFRRGELETTFLPFPPLGEQQKITEILSTVDEAIQKTDEITAKGERLKKALMNELLAGRIRVREENGRLSFYRETELQETEIGEMPRDWKVKKLGEITTEMYYGLTAKAVEQGTGLRMLRTTDIKDYKVDWSSLPYCEITDYRNYNLRKYLLRKNDIIISRAGTAGVSVLVDRDFDDIIFGSYLIKVRLNEAFVHPKFIHNYMQSDLYWKQILPRQAGSTLKNISIPILKSIIIPLPSTNEQVKIAEILSTIDRAIESYREGITRLERLKRGLMDLLLTGKVRVVDGDVGS